MPSSSILTMTLSVILSFFLLGILLPAVVSGLIFLLLRFIAKDVAAPVAIAAGFFAGFLGISGLGGYAFPPRTVQNWLPHITVSALALGLLEHYILKNIWFYRRFKSSLKAKPSKKRILELSLKSLLEAK